jgi:nucleotide-binding universal stress UspA family protein
MDLIRHILVATDFSADTEEAQRVAANLAKQLDAEITLLHVYEPVAWAVPDGYMLYTPDQMSELLAEADRLLALGKARLETSGVRKASTKLVQGIVAVEVVEEAARGKYDLLIVGTHGRTGVSHAVMGSIAEKIVRTARCPVLSVRSKK